MKHTIQIYYIIIEHFKHILKEQELENDAIFTIGLHMLEHILKTNVARYKEMRK